MNPFDSAHAGGTSLHQVDYRGSYRGQSERREERGSLSGSGSDDGHYPPYSDTSKTEADEDENLSLTSQTLNADGTPKRPMNAFMIFARRRRPQVSSENQAMRTGEISKILSREWNAMPPSEKQFYQDQAKQLKETFNSKYPDYVYRRRPNNTRKRRRTDATATKQGENPVPVEAGDDTSGFGDVGESPTSGDDIQGGDVTHELHHPRPSHQIATPYHDPHKFGASSSRPSYGYGVSDLPYRSNGAHDTRLPFHGGGSERLAGELPVASPLGSSHITHPLHYQYMPPSSRTHASGASAGLYGPETVTQHEQWDPSIVRSSPWLAGGQEGTLASLTGSKPQVYPSSGSPSTWQTPPPGTPSGAPAPPASYTLQTLNSPFYPVSHGQGHIQSPPQPPLHVPPVYGQSQLPPSVIPGRSYETEYSASPPAPSPADAYPPGSSREPMAFGQRPSSVSRSLRPIPGYDQSQSPTGNGTGSAHPYWTRD